MIAVFGILSVFTLAACGGTTDPVDQNQPATSPLSSEYSLATLSYLSTGFLSQSTTPTVSNPFAFLNNQDETEIEGELDTVTVYFDRLKGMIDNGVDSFGSVVEEASDNELYEYKLTFTVNEEVYVIYYNLDDVSGEMTGIIVIDSVEYTFEVIDNMREYKFGEQEKNEHREQNTNNDDDEVDTEDDELDEDDDVDTEDADEVDIEEEDDDQESETKMMLIARNGDDSIKIMYKTETEEDEQTIKFDMEQTIAGVTKNVFLKISTEEDEYKIDIIDGEDTFTFKQEVEDEGVIEYKLTYNVNGVSGTVKITETVDENGDVVYEYKIQEGGRQKSMERGRPDYDFDDDEDDEEQEEDNEQEDTTSTDAGSDL
jgi:hypothetical protein